MRGLFHVYHESLKSRATSPQAVRPCHWVKQADCDTFAAAHDAAINMIRQGCHARVTWPGGSRCFRGEGR